MDNVPFSNTGNKVGRREIQIYGKVIHNLWVQFGHFTFEVPGTSSRR